MKKTNYLFILFVVSLCFWVVLYIKSQSKIDLVNIDESQIQNQNTKKQNDGVMEYTDDLYKIKFSYLKDYVLIHDEKDKNGDRNFYLTSKNLIENQPLAVSINLLKGENKYKLPILSWWDSNGFNTEKQGPEPYKKENVKVGGEDAVKLYFSSNSFGGGDFGPVVYYIPHNTDIFEIWGTHLLNVDNFSPTDIQSAHEYEKIFEQILASFKFVQ